MRQEQGWDQFFAGSKGTKTNRARINKLFGGCNATERQMSYITKAGWFRRAIMAVAFVGTGLVTMGAATAPAQAYYYYPGYYGYPYYGYPAYSAYYPYYGYGYGYPAVGVRVGWGWGWGGGWHGGWGGGWHGGWGGGWHR
jgi:hypothetical protein